MSYPTGMSAGTGNHYNKVAAQMQQYLRHSQPRKAYAPRYDAPYAEHAAAGEAMAAHLFHYGAQRMGLPPMVANELSGVAINVVRNLLR